MLISKLSDYRPATPREKLSGRKLARNHYSKSQRALTRLRNRSRPKLSPKESPTVRRNLIRSPATRAR